MGPDNQIEVHQLKGNCPEVGEVIVVAQPGRGRACVCAAPQEEGPGKKCQYAAAVVDDAVKAQPEQAP